MKAQPTRSSEEAESVNGEVARVVVYYTFDGFTPVNVTLNSPANDK